MKCTFKCELFDCAETWLTSDNSKLISNALENQFSCQGRHSVLLLENQLVKAARFNSLRL